jgi:hypothetical protein
MATKIWSPLLDNQDFILFFAFKIGFRLLEYDWGVDWL